ncbi:MAG: FliI/YscN family ATPase [Pseudomonadota bacterium]
MTESSPVLDRLGAQISAMAPYLPAGRLQSAHGALIEARLSQGAIGELCEVFDPSTGRRTEADLIGFREGIALLAPSDRLDGLSPAAEIRTSGRRRDVPVGRGLLGRVIDPRGRPLDGQGRLCGIEGRRRLEATPPPAMERRPITRPFPVGIRAIDGVLTCGAGQRIGVFGEPGGGKSTLLAALVRGSKAPVCVIGLVGERGREVREFVEDTLGTDGLARSVVVVATSDQPAVERASAALAATSVAEHFRDAGQDVLLVIDSITRFARARRDLALASGALPARRGYPPSALAELPALLERAGCSDRGSITAIYTVLIEGDGTGDPVAEDIRGILDGHIMLSPDLAAKGHYPAIDITRSKSRIMPRVTDDAQRGWAADIVAMMAKLDEIELLVQVGEYSAGSDPLADRALAARKSLMAFLRQTADEVTPIAEVWAGLKAVAT